VAECGLPPGRRVNVAGWVTRLAAARRLLLVVVVYLLAWTALDTVASQFQAARGVSLWYPPPALDLVLVFGLRYTPALLLNTIIHTALVNPVGLDPLHVAAFDLATTAGYAGAALVLLRGVRIDPRLPTQRDVLWLVVVACGAGPLLVAAAQVTLLCTAGVLRWSQLPLSVAGEWAGSATGVAMLAPVLLLAARRWSATRPAGWPSGWVGRPPLPADPPGLGVLRPELVGQLLVLTGTVYAA
jgi:integral membrane sensor domain MASE1